MPPLKLSEEKLIEYKNRAAELVSKMTLEQKIRQMLHSAPAIEELNIPSYNWWNEALHGVARAGTATVFPQAIGLAASFDEELLEEVATAVAVEARAKYNMQQKFGDHDIYKGLTMWTPNINIFRDPRWGRGHETYGEDPYLTSRLGVRFIQGLQGDDENYMNVAACAKHFAVHSGPEGERHSFNAVASTKDLYETYLPAFEAAVKEAKVEAVMGAYNRTNGEPCCGSPTLLQKILRDTWEFDGHVVSDCWAIKDFHEYHKVTANAVESVALAVNSGCDLNCGSLFVFLIDAVKEGLVKEETITRAVTRLFTTRMKLGMFDEAEYVKFNQITYDQVDTKQMQQLNERTVHETVVLLKNENNILPLNKSKLKTVGVVGPNANSRRALVGNYEGTASRYITVLEGIQDELGDEVRVLFSEGCHLFNKAFSGLGDENDRLAEVKGVCEQSDVVVVVLGLDADLEGEEGDTGNQFASGDKPDLEFPGKQNDVLKAAYESGKPVILVVLAGSAMNLSYADEHVAAIIQGWYPGARGGKGIAEIIFGKHSPAGKLPVTFYRSTEELPAFTDYSMENRTYRYMKQEALYPFGYGLSYSSFELTPAELSTTDISEVGVTIKATLTNTGAYKTSETVQVYVQAVGQAGAPNWQLKALKKYNLEAGQSQQVELKLSQQAFALYDDEGVRKVEAGEYHVFVGFSQPDRRSTALLKKQPQQFTLKANSTLVIE